MISGHGEDKIVLDCLAAMRRLDDYAVRRNFFYLGAEVRLHIAILDAVFNIRLDPVLHVLDESLRRDAPG